MTLIYRFGAVLMTILLLAPVASIAQQSGDDEAAVWATVEAIWNAEGVVTAMQPTNWSVKISWAGRNPLRPPNQSIYPHVAGIQ